MLVCSCFSCCVAVSEQCIYRQSKDWKMSLLFLDCREAERWCVWVCACLSHSWLSQNNPYITRLYYTSLTLEKQNDMCPRFSLCTTLCLQWEPEIIAIALMYLAGKLSKFEVTDWAGRQAKHQRWWDMYVEGISMELLEGEWAPVLPSAVERVTLRPSILCDHSWGRLSNFEHVFIERVSHRTLNSLF